MASNNKTKLMSLLSVAIGSGLIPLLAGTATAEQVSNWQAYLEPHATDPTTKYQLIFEWDHMHDETIFVDGEDGGRVYNADNDPRCNGDSSILASDSIPFWMPRFFPRPVSEEITNVTGVKFASADWQPCGHKEITICHAESHYDFHMYYEDEEVMNALPMCEIGVPTNPDLPVCQDSATEITNHEYFQLINHSIPLSMSVSSPNSVTPRTLVEDDKNFCVDPSSAVLRSGVHYGDASETLEEWKTPVTITGSHKCQLKFFEPMFSWKWVSGCVPDTQTSWPVYEVQNIKYTKKGIESLPDAWKIEVSEACKAQSCFPGQMDPPTSDVCHIKITVEGDKCPEEGCNLLTECGSIEDCSTGSTYVSPWTGGALLTETGTGVPPPTIDIPRNVTGSTPAANGTSPSLVDVARDNVGGSAGAPARDGPSTDVSRTGGASGAPRREGPFRRLVGDSSDSTSVTAFLYYSSLTVALVSTTFLF